MARIVNAPIKTFRSISEHRAGLTFDYQNKSGEILDLGFNGIAEISSSTSSEKHWIVGEYDASEVAGGKLTKAQAVLWCESVSASGGSTGSSQSHKYSALFYGLLDSIDLTTVKVSDLYDDSNIIKPEYTGFEYSHIGESTVAINEGASWDIWWEEKHAERSIPPGSTEDRVIAGAILAKKKFYIKIDTIGYSVSGNRNLMTKVGGQGSENPPYVELYVDDVEIQVSSASPASGYVKKDSPNVFSWGVSYDTEGVVGIIKPETAKFRWRNAGTTEYSEIEVSGSSYTVPQNTFGDGDIEWQVEVTSNAGTTATSEWYTVTTIDKTAIAVPIAPINTIVIRDVANVFSWDHTTEYGTEQTAAQLQYSDDLINWLPLVSVTGSEKSATVFAYTLPVGTVYWRVRTYNANEVAGEWSAAAAIVVKGLVNPVISSVSNEAFVNVMWTAELQQGYEIVIESENNIYKSGVQLGTEKQYRFKTPIADGSYTAKVRVYYNNGEASPWAEYPFTLSTEKPTEPIISASPIINGVKIDVISENDVYILRNGEVIGKAINGEFTDYAAIGENLYTARAVNESYNFADSLAVKASAVIVGSVVATADKPKETLQLSLNLNGQPQREFSWEQMGGITHYAGRKYPVYEHAEQENESYNFAFAFRTQSEYEKFMNLAKRKKPILYRDQYGLKVYGIITGVSPSVSWAGYAVTFSVTKIDYNEAVEYDL